MSKYARRRDANHSELQKKLEQIGFTVKAVDMHSGLGCDLLVKRMSDPDGDIWLVEVKNPAMSPSARKLTEKEAELKAMFPERFRVLERAEDANEVLR